MDDTEKLQQTDHALHAKLERMLMDRQGVTRSHARAILQTSRFDRFAAPFARQAQPPIGRPPAPDVKVSETKLEPVRQAAVQGQGGQVAQPSTPSGEYIEFNYVIVGGVLEPIVKVMAFVPP